MQTLEALLNPTHKSALFDALLSGQACIEFDLNGRVKFANTNFLNTFGYEFEDIAGKHHSMFCQPGIVNQAEYKQFWESLQSGEGCSGEFLRLNSKGEPVYISASYSPVHNEQGEVISVVKDRNEHHRSQAESTGSRLQAECDWKHPGGH